MACMGVNHGWECYYVAVRGAAAHNGSLQERLQQCVLVLLPIRRDDFPNDETFDRHKKLISETTKRAERHPDGGTLIATTSQMSDEEATRLLWEICDLFSIVTDAGRIHGRG